MSNYWKKKMDELEEEKTKSTSQSYWDRKTDELKNEKKTTVRTAREDDDDIAPIKSTKEDEDGGLFDFFQKGAFEGFDIGKRFEDGWQFGDVAKTYGDLLMTNQKATLGTVADAGVNVVKGIAGIGEGIGDLISYGGAWVADKMGEDAFARGVREKAQESLVDNLMKPADDYLDKYSILGRTSESILQGVGQVGTIMATGGLGAAAGLGSTGVTALTTGLMGVSGVGSGMSEAYQGGANDLQALKHGLNSGAADALSELIFGGLGKSLNAVGFSKGLSSADDLLAKLASSKLKNQAAKNIVEFGIKAGAEGLEEVIAGVAQAYSKYHNYLNEQGMDFADVLKDENLLEQFIVGSLTSGVVQAPGLNIANKTGTDFITGRTQNEQAVVDKEVENRIAEAEEDGTKLTAKEKTAIQEQVEKDLEKGYISTDLIEEVVGGDTFKTYKSQLDEETKLQQEFDTLNKMKQGDMTGEQMDRRTELKDLLAEIKEKPKSQQLRMTLDQEVSEGIKGSRLMESYNERTRRGQKFEADLTKYDEKQQTVIKKAVESGILNNSNRTHEFVDMVAKISADKGVLFDFTNNEKLKTSAFAVDGKAVNGFVTKDGITINMQSAKALNTIVGHEITHVLEGTDLYTELQNAVVEYAKTKGDYQGRFDSLSKLYEAVEGADIHAELTADLVGDYLFTDPDFIHNLSTKHRNVFQKIYDEVKYLLKVARAGSKEARQLEKVKRVFEKAYRENGKQTDAKYSVTETTDGRSVAVVDNDILSNIDTSKWDKETKKAAQKAASNELKKFADGFVINGVEYIDSKKTRREYTKSDYSEALAKHDPEAYLDKMRAASVVDDVVRVATDWTKDGKLKYERKDFVDFVRGKTLIKSGDRTYRAVVLAGITKDGKTIFYDVEDVYPDSFEIKKSESYTTVSTDEPSNSILKDSDTGTIAQNGKNVKHSLSPQQEEYFKDSKIRDANGKLLTVYHGTPNGDFTVFKEGTYFTDNKAYADRYQNPGASSISTGKTASSPKTFEAYLNITKPFDINDAEARRIYIEDYIKGGNAMGINPYLSDAEYAKINTIDWTEGEDLRDFLIENEYDYDGLILDEGGTGGYGDEVQSRGKSYVVFSSEQVKSVDNRKPTADKDIRFSLSEDVQAAEKYFGTTYKIKEAGYLLTDGKFLDFSGKHEGAPGGYRTVDHRDITDAFDGEYGDGSYSGGMIQFISSGNIRLSPEIGGINLSVKPTKEQITALDRYISSFRGEVILDIDNAKGVTLVSVEYPARTYSKRIINDINAYFDNGTIPEPPSSMGQFRYSLSEDSQGHKLSEEQEAFFKDSVIRDENGSLMPMYHGTMKGGFTVFGGRKDYWYFTNDKKYAYTFEGRKANGQLYPSTKEGIEKGYYNPERYTVYLNVTNPFITDDVDMVEDALYWDKTLAGKLREKGYDALMLKDMSQVIVLNPHQIKNVSNKRPTSDPDIRYSASGNGKPYGRYNVYSKDVLLETAPVQEEATPVPETESVAPVAISETPSEEAPVAPAAEESTPAVLYNKRDGKGGWGEVYGTAQEALNDAVQNVNRELYNAFIEEVDNTPQNTQLTRGSMPITNALIAVQEDVRQETITPIQGAQLLSEAYAQGGVDALKQMVNLRNGNLWDRYLEKAKQYETVAPVTENLFPDDLAPVETEIARLEDEKAALEVRLLGLGEAEDFGEEFTSLSAEWGELDARIKALQAQESEKFDSLTDADAPPEMEAPYQAEEEPVMVDNPFEDRDWYEVSNRKVKAYMYENPEVKPFFQDEALALMSELKDTTKGERFYSEEAFAREGNESAWTGVSRHTSKSIETLLDSWGMSYADIEKGLNAIIEDHGEENIAAAKKIEFMLNDRLLNGYTDFYTNQQIPPNQEYVNLLAEMEITAYSKEAFEQFMASADQYAPPAQAEDIAPVKPGYVSASGEQMKLPLYHDPNKVSPALGEVQTEGDIAPVFEVTARKGVPEGQQAFLEDAGVPQAITRKQLHENIVDNIKATFAENGFDFETVLKNAKNLSTFATVDNTPQRVMEKALGYKAGGILSDITVNQVAQNETRGIQWLNSFTDRKNGLLAKLSKQYGIKPGSKESAAAQMYAEGFYVGKNDEIIRYGDAELAADFPDRVKQAQIKGLARDKSIRQIYDDTLKAINESRTRNAYPEIPRLENYFLHFRAQTDTFSRLGIPFNPNDIRAKDLPTDLNGVTADLKPGQPFFASAMHREGKRTDFDLLGGLEQYLTSAKNQIYHIDDIQTLRALRNYIADTYGQANGLSDLDLMSEEEAQERIKEVYGSHLSTFAKFLNEEANVLAGKTALIDRGVEGIIGRRGITFLDTVNKQVGKNMVGFNVSSSMTNFISVVQAFAKANKFDFVKALSQTAASKLKALGGVTDSFVENNPTIIRRKGAEKFFKTPYEKVSDAGYFLMSAVDNLSTEIIVRAKYNELTRKGMDQQKAAFEADKWVSRLMGDRSLGQQPQLYNSKMLGLLTKFQLEVRNQLDSQFYDTIQEAKVSSEHIENRLLRNAKTAAKVGSTFFQLAVLQHVFGKAFESVAGYNPAFDIIEALVAAFGWDDDEEDEDTVLDNIEEGFMVLLEDLPYSSTFTGGRIPISSALPVKQFITGKDQYGNEKSRVETLAEAAPYYIAPGGYGQLKKTVAGLKMFSDEHPIAGSYTDSGNLRFPVEDTLGNRVQAAVFGQWASGNARDYFDNERKALTPKQTQELIDVGISIQDYWKYREGLSGLNTLEQKLFYIDSLNLTTAQKNVLANNLTDRKEAIDMTDFDEFGSLSEFDYANDNPEKYSFFEKIGITYEQYQKADDDTKEAYDWAFKYPAKYQMSKAVSDDYLTFWQYKQELSQIDAKDENGETVNGLRKERVIDYINNLDMDYGQRIILYRSMYSSQADRDEYNSDILDYLNSRDDLTYEEKVAILKELDFTVTDDGDVYWE